MADREKVVNKGKGAPCQVAFFLNEHLAGEGTSIHFNERGMLVRCEKPASLNKRLKLLLQFPGIGQSLEVQGVVVWTNAHGPADGFTPRGMGVKFLSLDRKVERLLAQISSQYESHGDVYSCYYS